MVSFEEKAKIKKAGNLNKGPSYVITTVLVDCRCTVSDSSAIVFYTLAKPFCYFIYIISVHLESALQLTKHKYVI